MNVQMKKSVKNAEEVIDTVLNQKKKRKKIVITMTDRDRLIEILQDTLYEWECDVSIKTLTEITEHLIANGVIAPPCKVGDTVYYITGIGHNLIKPAKIKEIIIDEDGITDLYVQGDGHNFENSFDIFFLTREEAEAKLKELNNNVR